MQSLESLLSEVRQCRECEVHLPLGPRPVLAAHEDARLLLIGQAPGTKVHETGVPWDDPSGERLRDWMGISSDDFYDPAKVAIIPMGFCYPGRGRSGDLPPRPECAPLWHERLLSHLGNIQLTMVIGRYAQDYCLEKASRSTLTDTVRGWKNFTPKHLPMPHPSPRNNLWLKKNPWFEKDVVPYLKQRIRRLFGKGSA